MTEIELEIIFEDDYLLAINKPSNLIVHQSKFGGQIDEFSLSQILNKNKVEKAHPIHRLDRKTSGVILFSKVKQLIPILQNQFSDQSIQKTYLALVRGHIIEEGKIDTPIRAEEETEHKEALTLFKPLKQFLADIPVKPYPQSRYTLVELYPKTGRTHQLRKHMNKISHPIIGDPKYGNRHHNHMFIEKLEVPNLFLHAKSLRFIHPVSNKEITIEAKLPEFWDLTFKSFNWDLD